MTTEDQAAAHRATLERLGADGGPLTAQSKNATAQNPEWLAAVLAKAERDREQAEQKRSAGRDENAQARQLLAEAAREDQDREQDVTEENQRPEPLGEEAGMKYDSAERRKELAASLEGVADREAVQARLSADQDQDTPPSAAVATAPGRSPKARKTRGDNGQTKLLQKGMSR